MRWDWVVDNAGRIGDLAWAHFSLSWPAILASFLIALPIGWFAHRPPAPAR